MNVSDCLEFQWVNCLAKCQKFNAGYFISNTLRQSGKSSLSRKMTAIEGWLSTRIILGLTRPDWRKLLWWELHPNDSLSFYSLNLLPSNFWRFGDVKGQLMGQSFETREKTFQAFNVFWMISIQRYWNRFLRTEWWDFKYIFNWKGMILNKFTYYYFIEPSFTRGLEMLRDRRDILFVTWHRIW
jgi:hypothetical protein